MALCLKIICSPCTESTSGHQSIIRHLPAVFILALATPFSTWPCPTVLCIVDFRVVFLPTSTASDPTIRSIPIRFRFLAPVLRKSHPDHHIRCIESLHVQSNIQKCVVVCWTESDHTEFVFLVGLVIFPLVDVCLSYAVDDDDNDDACCCCCRHRS